MEESLRRLATGRHMLPSFLRVARECSIHCYSRSCRRSLHLDRNISARVINFEVESSLVRFVVCRDRIHFVHAKRGFYRPVRIEHKPDMVQLDRQVADFLPHTEADVASHRRQKSILEFRSVRMPCLEGFQECRSIIGSVVEMPQTDNRRWPVGHASSLMRQPGQHWARRRLKRIAASGSGSGRAQQQPDHGRRNCGKPASPNGPQYISRKCERLLHGFSPQRPHGWPNRECSLGTRKGGESAPNFTGEPRQGNAPRVTLPLILVHQLSR